MAALEQSERIFSRMVEVRRKIHEHPELAFEEAQTAENIIEELTRIGLPFDYPGIGGGVVARLSSGKADAPFVALRAEMDALPGQERTGLPFASKIPGRMHACGHDAHTAMVLGAAELLCKSPPPGDVLFVFQPAEENGAGSKVVLKSGAVTGAKAIFAGHVTHQYPAGEIMVDSGTITAQSDRFQIWVKGKGGHGARPHEAIDAVVIAASLVTTVQTLVSRESNPVHPAVITVGRVIAGTAANAISETAYLDGSIRSTLPAVREHLHRGLKRICSALGELHNAQIKLEITPGYPPVINSPEEAEDARRAAARVVGEINLHRQDHPSMGSEDFAYFLEKIPGCYVRFGARPKGSGFVPLHSPVFDIDEEVLKVGAAFYDEVVRETLERHNR